MKCVLLVMDMLHRKVRKHFLWRSIEGKFNGFLYGDRGRGAALPGPSGRLHGSAFKAMAPEPARYCLSVPETAPAGTITVAKRHSQSPFVTARCATSSGNRNAEHNACFRNGLVIPIVGDLAMDLHLLASVALLGVPGNEVGRAVR